MLILKLSRSAWSVFTGYERGRVPFLNYRGAPSLYFSRQSEEYIVFRTIAAAPSSKNDVFRASI